MTQFTQPMLEIPDQSYADYKAMELKLLFHYQMTINQTYPKRGEELNRVEGEWNPILTLMDLA